jgi:urea transport system ATP-binding protein
MLTINNLDVYYGESQILDKVNITVPTGQAVCIMGRNGVGKTTLMKATMGLLKPRGGSIKYEDKDLTRLPSHLRARASIGYVPQGRGIFPHLSVFENLMVGFEAVKRPTPQFVAERLEEVYSIFPVVKQMRHRIAGTLSGGQQQQLAIGRALVSQPTLVLLDEPTEGIQPSIVQEIEEIILKLRFDRSISVLLVEQFLDFALRIADYCYVMEKGRIVSEGNAADLSEEIIQEHLSV